MTLTTLVINTCIRFLDIHVINRVNERTETMIQIDIVVPPALIPLVGESLKLWNTDPHLKSHLC